MIASDLVNVKAIGGLGWFDYDSSTGTEKLLSVEIDKPAYPSGTVALMSSGIYNYRTLDVGSTVGIKVTIGQNTTPFTIYKNGSEWVKKEGNHNEGTEFVYTYTVETGTTEFTYSLPWGGTCSLTFTTSSASAPSPYQLAFNPFVAYAEGGNPEPTDLTKLSSNPLDSFSFSGRGITLPEGYGLDTSFGYGVIFSGNYWEETFHNLDVKDSRGDPYYYVIVEIGVPDNYEVSYTNNPVNAVTAQASGTIATLTATNTTTTKTVYARKVWKQGETALTDWPAGITSVTFQLQEQSSSGWSNVEPEKTVNSLDTVSWPDLNATKTYRVIETKVNGTAVSGEVVASGEGTTTSPYVITNTVEKVDIPVRKTWSSNPPPGTTATVELVKVVSGQDVYFSPAKTLELNSGNNWQANFTGLDKYNEDGTAITYRVIETKVTCIGKEYTGAALTNAFGSNGKASEPISAINATTAELANTYEPETGKLTVEKVWKDEAGNVVSNEQTASFPSITFKLYQKLTPLDGAPQLTTNATVEYDAGTIKTLSYNADAANSWKAEFNSLPLVVEVDGHYYTCSYYVQEVQPSGYNAPKYRLNVNGDEKTSASSVISNAAGDDTIFILNQKTQTYTLPSTGGAGTGIFYAAGGILLALAALGLIYLNRKRSMGDGI